MKGEEKVGWQVTGCVCKVWVVVIMVVDDGVGRDEEKYYKGREIINGNGETK